MWLQNELNYVGEGIALAIKSVFKGMAISEFINAMSPFVTAFKISYFVRVVYLSIKCSRHVALGCSYYMHNEQNVYSSVHIYIWTLAQFKFFFRYLLNYIQAIVI